jgi:hypothetical protein
MAYRTASSKDFPVPVTALYENLDGYSLPLYQMSGSLRGATLERRARNLVWASWDGIEQEQGSAY